jgi:hypothetical protein
MNRFVRTGIGLAMVAFVAGAAPAAAQPKKHAALTLPAAGTFEGGGQFKGTVSITRFERRGNQIFAIGFVAGVLSVGTNAVGTGFAGEVAWPVTVSSGSVSLARDRAPAPRVGNVTRVAFSPEAAPAATLVPVQAETCPVLNVALGPIAVDLLGFQVALGAVTLDLTGVTGTPLGDLVCAASALLSNVAALVNLLNSILGLVTGLLGGLLGGLGGAVPTP